MERDSILSVTAVLFLLASQILLPNTSMPAVEEPQSKRDAFTLFREVLSSSHEDRFDEALQAAQQIREQFPDEPLGIFGQLITYQTINRNYRIRLFDTQVDSLLELAIELSEKALKNNGKSAHSYYCKGTAYGLRSLDRAAKKQWMAAFRDGSKVIDSFEKALKLNPKHYDSYLGMGLFNYWVGANSKLLRAFTKKRREKGIRQLSLVASKGDLLKTDGQFSLKDVYYNEGDYEAALDITNHLLEAYPTNTSLLYKRGRILQKLHRWHEARDDFVTLYQFLKSARYKSKTYQMDSLYQLALCEFELGNYAESQKACQLAIRNEKQSDLSREREGHLDRFEDLQKDLHKLHKEVQSLVQNAVSSAGSQ